MNKYFNKHTIVLITGASSGIGKELAKLLITKYGATVFGSGRNEEKLNKARDELGENFVPLKFDAGEKSEWERIYNYFKDNGLKLGCLINCAGVLPAFSKFNKTHFEVNEKAIYTNYFSVVYSSYYMMPLLEEVDKPLLINVSSSSALCPFAGISLYSSTKSAVRSFSETLSCENKKIRVVTVMPGFTKTDVMRDQTATKKEQKLIDLMSKSAPSVARIIIRKASRGRRRIITGFDAKFMNFIYKVSPSTAPRFLSWFMRKTKMTVFKNI